MPGSTSTDGWDRPDRPVPLAVLMQMDVRAPHLVVEHPTAGPLYRAIPDRKRLTIGRAAWCDIVVGWDDTVSRTHVVVERFGPLLSLEPAGPVTNPVAVDGAAVLGRVPLRDAQSIVLGGTTLFVRLPVEAALDDTLRVEDEATEFVLSRAERRVLTALERDPDATNQALGDALGLSVETVRSHLQAVRRKARAAGWAGDDADRAGLAAFVADRTAPPA